MTGTIEELQHSVRVPEEQLRAARPGERSSDNARVGAAPPAAAERRGDALDPAGAGAPGHSARPRPRPR